MVKNKDKDNPIESEEEDVSTDFVTYADTASALELVRRYDMQNSTNATTPNDGDMIFMRCWNYITLSGRFNFLRRKKVTNFVSIN
ncbi:hypothetical protein AVEN_171476-1 [Araneus ventricosus]|uniref:Uncharacterized protein n=1 Tax=Araneus ventricosus TaxID=182803 RepID=A0A4Y2HR78_ARAVE|nr:hypothetical protein AVEN_171476-1 [Araneus ventricosus]